MNAQSAKIMEVADDSVVLSINKSTIYWPKDDIPDAKVGDEVYLVAMKFEDLNKHKNDIAKSLLNNVLNPEK